MIRLAAALAALTALAGCQCGADSPPSTEGEAARPGREAPDRVTISVIGTNDLHGHIETLPILGGYLTNLRAARQGRGGVLLVDGGDIFQGTLESNLVEGASVVRAYDALGYSAVTIGNHEFDFGPRGPSPIPESRGDDPRGALKARAAEASFPFLMANVVEADSGEVPEWENVAPVAVTEIAGVAIGIIGVTTIDTPRTTIAHNFEGLAMRPLAPVIEGQATRLRAAGAAVVVVAAHAGGRCHEFHDPHQHDSCAADAEIFQVARQLPSGLVDVIVAGHTHSGVAHRVNGIAIIESFSYGRAFGRVDLIVRDGAIKESVIFPPRFLCGPEWRSDSGEPCQPGSYEGADVRADPVVGAIADRAAAAAERERERPLGVTLESRIRRSYREESALGNLFTDLMRAARPRADVALTNAGGLRADLPAGPLTYGELYLAMPFDNRFAFVTLRAEQLADIVADNLASSRGVFSVSGIRVRARCAGSQLRVELQRPDGSRIPRGEELLVATSDFLAAGGDGVFSRLDLPEGAIEVESGVTIRDAMAAELGERKGTLRRADVFDPEERRLVYPGSRPVACPR